MRDHKRRRSERRDNNRRGRGSTSRRTPGWVWVLTAICVAGLIVLGFYLYDRNQQKQLTKAAAEEKAAATEKKKSEKAAAEAKKKADTAKEEEQRFDFYNILPKQEVVIPESEIREERERLAAKEIYIYTLQTGAFGNHSDADTLKARLAMLGVESRIESTTTDGVTKHKVRIGPFNNSRDMNRTRNRLNSNRISTLVLREKKTP